ncbi:hypothetical protein, partial [Vibrio sp. S12_S33]|uniref:hypothetical protein n=1 Tax=Vibrio sp. S12_S33 TaxID=2720223 RepID=UPI0030DB191D
HRLSVSIVLGMVNSVVICFWRNDYNLHHAVQKIITKDQQTLVNQIQRLDFSKILESLLFQR